MPSNAWGPFTLTQSAVNYIWLACTATAGLITGATVTVGSSAPSLAANTSASPPTSFNILLAIVDLTGSNTNFNNVVGYGNIWTQPYVAFFDTINTGAILTAPFTPWYNWEWGAGTA